MQDPRARTDRGRKLGGRAGSPCRGSKLRGLIAILALEAGSTVTTQRLIDALWGDQPVQGSNALQVLVSKLRRSLVDAGEGPLILTQPSGYQLDVEPRRDRCAPLRGAARRRSSESR